MKLIDPARTLDGTGPTVEILPIGTAAYPPRPPWWRWRARRRWTSHASLERWPRFRLRVTDAAGRTVLDVDDYTLCIALLYGEPKR